MLHDNWSVFRVERYTLLMCVLARVQIVGSFSFFASFSGDDYSVVKGEFDKPSVSFSCSHSGL